MIYFQLIYIIGVVVLFLLLHFYNDATNWFGGALISIVWPFYLAWYFYSIKKSKCPE